MIIVVRTHNYRSTTSLIKAILYNCKHIYHLINLPASVLPHLTFRDLMKTVKVVFILDAEDWSK